MRKKALKAHFDKYYIKDESKRWKRNGVSIGKPFIRKHPDGLFYAYEINYHYKKTLFSMRIISVTEHQCSEGMPSYEDVETYIKGLYIWGDC